MAVVDDNKYKPNSYKSKAEAEDRKIEKVIKGEATIRKKSLGKKFAETFLGDEVDNVRSYLIFDVVVPAIKETLSDAVSKGIDMLLFGEARGGGRRNRGGNNTYVSYNEYSRPRNRQSARQARFDFSDIDLDSRSDAEDVLDALEDIIEMYDVARVADLYELVGITGSHTDNKWGWTNIDSASVSRTRNGKYILNMPRPKPIG